MYTALFLAALLAQFAVETVVDRLNLRAVKPALPPEFQDVFDPERYQRAQAYLRARTALGLVSRTTQLVALLAVWLTGSFGILDRAVRSLGFGPILTGLLFMGALLFAQVLLGLPFRYYATFVIEERFGFNRTTLGTFVSDLLKGALLSIVLGGALGGLVLLVFERTGSLAPLYGWLAVAAVLVLLQFIAPRWLFPLFMKFMPLPDNSLRARIVGYCASIGVPLHELFVVDGSRRSNKANAFFTGFGSNRRIGLFDTLIARHTEDEVVAVVAHEVGHYKLGHVTRGMWLGILQLGLVFFAFGFGMRQRPLFDAFYVDQMSVYAGLTLCTIVFGPIELIGSIITHARSRRHEFEADAFAIQTTGLGPALGAGLKKLSADSLDNLNPHPAYVFLHYTHPPIAQRLARIAAQAAHA